MEYPFKDLLPLDEVLEREGYYKDWTHLDPEVFYSLTQISEYIKTKGYGVDVRLLIAQLAEHFGLKTTQVVDLGNLIQTEHATLKQQVQRAVAQVNADRNALETKFNQSVSQVNSDRNALQSSFNQSVTQMEADKNAVIANATSDSEVILSRGGFDTLGARLNETSKKIGRTNMYTKDTFNYLSDGARKTGAAVTFIADDAPKNDLTKLLPIMEEKGVPFGIAVVSEWIGKTIHSSDFVGGSETFMDVDELRYMQERGAQILSHTATHTAMIDESVDVEREMRSSYEKLSELGFVVDGLVYPYNSYTAESIAVAKEYYKYSFSRYTSNLVGKMDNNKLNRYSLGAYYDIPSMSEKGHDTSSLAYYKERVDYAIENNEWLVFVLHTHTTNFPEEQQQHLRDTIDYIQSLGVDIVSPRDGFNRLGNIMQVGDFKIDSSGKLTGVHEVYKGSAGTYGITGHTPITDFEKGKVSVHRVGRGDVTLANGYPTNNVFGILKTAYLDIWSQYFAYQTLESLEENGFYIRHWHQTDNAWGEWSSKANIIGHEVYNGSASENGITGLSPITDFEEGKVSVYRVGRGDVTPANGYPTSNVFGILKTTYLEYWEPYFAYQTLESFEENSFYIRYWQPGGNAWSEWTSKANNMSVLDPTPDGITGLSPITEFDKGKITAHKFGKGNVTAALGFPVSNVFGVLTTVRIDEVVPEFAYQTFEINGHTNEKVTFKRHWDNGQKKWTAWFTDTLPSTTKLDITNLDASQFSVKNYSLVNIKSTVGTIQLSKLTDGFNGQRLTILVTSSTPVTFINNDNYTGDSFKLKGNANRTLGMRESITFTRIDFKWYEV